MWSAIFKFLGENFPVILICIILIAIVWVVAKFYFTRFKKVEDECAKISNLEKDLVIGIKLSKTIEDKIDSQTDKYSELNSKLQALSTNINSLVTFLTVKHTDLQSGLFQSFSPIQLTEVGIDVLEISGGKQYIDENVEFLISEMEKQNFKSALDVQNYATTFIINKFNDDGFIHIRNYLFQNPVHRTQGMQIQLNAITIQQIMGIYLRDKYFEKHPEIKDIE